MAVSEQVVARGEHEGLSWEFRVRRPDPDRLFPRAGHLAIEVRLSGGERPLYGGGGSAPLPSPDHRLHVTTGGASEGPYIVAAAVHPSVVRVETLVTGGDVIPMPVYDDDRFPEARFSVCLLPRDIRLDCVRACDAQGIELAQFDLAHHQEFWHRGRTPASG